MLFSLEAKTHKQSQQRFAVERDESWEGIFPNVVTFIDLVK